MFKRRHEVDQAGRFFQNYRQIPQSELHWKSTAQNSLRS
jgi:hypothetical protein